MLDHLMNYAGEIIMTVVILLLAALGQHRLTRGKGLPPMTPEEFEKAKKEYERDGII